MKTWEMPGLIFVAVLAALLGATTPASALPSFGFDRSLRASIREGFELVRGGFRGGRPHFLAHRRPFFNRRGRTSAARNFLALRRSRGPRITSRYPWMLRRNQPTQTTSNANAPGANVPQAPSGRTQGASIPRDPGGRRNNGGNPIARSDGITPPPPTPTIVAGPTITILGAGGVRAPIAPRYSRSSIQPPSAAAAALLNNKRYRPRELLLEVANDSGDALRQALSSDYGVQIREIGVVELLGARIWHITLARGQDLRSVLERFLQDGRIVSVQPNYIYTPVQGARQSSAQPPGASPPRSAPFRAAVAPGAGVKVAIIDTCIDRNHSEIQGAVSAFFDATAPAGTDCRPEDHGTAVASLIGGHGQIQGPAAGASLMSVRAFATVAGESEITGTSEAIFMALNWATSSKSQVANLSFAGPSDPLVERAVAGAYRKGVVLIGAAGNGGPASEPLYPGAYPEVIAVTAIDGRRRLYDSANRGSYIAIAARGVDVIVAHVHNQYGTDSGTSFAAATVSGIVALMLERRPKAGPEEIRAALQETAVSIAGSDQPQSFGHGLVNAQAAMAFVEAKVSR